jgi:hypothetical protein
VIQIQFQSAGTADVHSQSMLGTEGSGRAFHFICPLRVNWMESAHDPASEYFLGQFENQTIRLLRRDENFLPVLQLKVTRELCRYTHDERVARTRNLDL